LHQVRFVTNGKVQTELLDQFADEGPKEASSIAITAETMTEAGEIGFNQAVFSWSAEESSESVFRLQIEKTLFKTGKMNLIVGPTGSGKTSMLLALLGMLLLLSPLREVRLMVACRRTPLRALWF
jgi:ABC-type multidrug transport system fused ATPase/permease subunit